MLLGGSGEQQSGSHVVGELRSCRVGQNIFQGRQRADGKKFTVPSVVSSREVIRQYADPASPSAVASA